MGSPGLSVEGARAGGDPNYKLDVGGLIVRSFSTWAGNMLPFSVVGLLVFSPVMVGHVLIDRAGPVPPFVATGLQFLQGVLGVLLTGAVTYGVFMSVRGEKASLGQVLGKGLSRLGPVWAVSFLSTMLTGLGIFVFVVPGLIVLSRLWLATPVAVIEKPGIWSSLTRSDALSEGNRWPIFAMAVLIVIVNWGGTRLLGIGVGLLPFSHHAVAGETQLTALGQVLAVVGHIPLDLLAAIAPALGYHDLRTGKEGADVEELLSVFD